MDFVGVILIMAGVIALIVGLVQKSKAGRMTRVPFVKTGDAASRGEGVADPKGAKPAASRKQPMVFAVPIMEQVPAVAQKRSDQSRKVD